ncbi:efflux RND transporter periplasmic adaptor subunit [Sphingosinicellaceae bacterium]|nr:efflux RND transporter periplasmic adaptor subunit [Sphingosinicellaceae bacterium]
MKTGLPSAALLLLAGCGNSTPAPAPPPSVLVTLQPAVRGAAPEWLTAYGSAGPSGNGSQTVSVAQPGQVTRLAVTAGARVRGGQALLVFATAPSVLSSYKQARTTLAAAQQQRATTAQLLGQQLATRDQLTQADKAVSDAQAALAALQRDGAGSAQNTLDAPFAGVVTVVSVAPGDRTQPGAPLVTVARDSSIIATAGIGASDAGRVRLGQRATVERLTGGAQVSGRVIRIDGLLNPKTRMIDVDIAVPAGSLLPNEGVRAEIAVGTVSGWLVPHDAVVTANGPVRVFQAVGNKAHAVKVRLLLPGKAVDVVEGPLDAARGLIVAGAYQLDDGAVIRSGGQRAER